jgi:hypothetical protein
VVLCWGLFLVTWTNAIVQDLRPELRLQYVTLVSESYAQIRNLDVARQRLAGWSSEDLAKLLADTQTVLVARDAGAAANVQQLAVAVGAAQGAAGEGAAPAQPAGTAAQQPSRLRQVCAGAIFVVIFLGALVAIVWGFRRWRATRISSDAEALPSDYGVTPQSAAYAAEQEKARPLGRQPYSWDEPLPSTTTGTSVPASSVSIAGSDLGTDAALQDDGVEPGGASTRTAPAARPVGPVPGATARTPPPEARAPVPAASVPPAKSTSGLVVLVENTAIYQMGEPDYDEAFDINDPVDGYMGQCGLQLIEPFGRERDQAVALQVWLWDSSDPDTQTLVLMSEGAYRDTALRSQYAGEHQAISVRPGTEFELASHDLLLRGRVEKVSYAEAEPVRGVYADLQVKMTIYRRS